MRALLGLFGLLLFVGVAMADVACAPICQEVGLTGSAVRIGGCCCQDRVEVACSPTATPTPAP